MEVKHSKLTITSYSIGNMVPDLIGAALSVMMFIFYENEVGLDTLYTGLALIIFALWDAVNDAIIGYISDPPNRFTKRWGRRFPWIAISYIPMLFFLVLIFMPPLGDDLIIFIWLIVTACVFEILLVVNLYSFFIFSKSVFPPILS